MTKDTQSNTVRWYALRIEHGFVELFHEQRAIVSWRASRHRSHGVVCCAEFYQLEQLSWPLRGRSVEDTRTRRPSATPNLKILRVPYVRFEKIRICECVTGQTDKPFVLAESFIIRLSVPAILRGVFEASQIKLEKPVLSLLVDNKGYL